MNDQATTLDPTGPCRRAAEPRTPMVNPITLAALAFAQFVALEEIISAEHERRWRQFAEQPDLFRRVVVDVPTKWLRELRNGYQQMVSMNMETESFETEAYNIAVDELHRRGGHGEGFSQVEFAGMADGECPF